MIDIAINPQLNSTKYIHKRGIVLYFVLDILFMYLFITVFQYHPS